MLSGGTSVKVSVHCVAVDVGELVRVDELVAVCDGVDVLVVVAVGLLVEVSVLVAVAVSVLVGVLVAAMLVEVLVIDPVGMGV